MAQEPRNDPDKAAPSTSAKTSPQRKYNWDDPKIPAGDAPPMPRWPLWLAAAAWGGWLVFVGVMVVLGQCG